MLINDVTLKAIQGDMFRFTILARGDLTGLAVAGEIRSGGTLVKHLTTEMGGGITLGTYDAVTDRTLVTVAVGARTTTTWTFAAAHFDIEVTPTDPDEAYKIAKGVIELMTEETHD
jgi:hypothetical protein